MSRFNRFNPGGTVKMTKISGKDIEYVDWKDVELLRSRVRG